MTIERFRGSSRSRSFARREGALLLALVLLLLLLAPVLARAQGADSLVLRWTAPADPPGARVARYDVRMSLATITAANFGSASALVGPTPSSPGARDSLLVRGLVHGTPAWFAIKSADAAGNWSPISNVVRWSGTNDTAPPAAPAGVGATVAGDGKSAALQWTPGTEPDLAGYNVYRTAASTSSWVKMNGALLTSASYTDAALPAGVTKLWYQVTAVDQSGNESARSATITVTVPSSLAGLVVAWRMQPPYPNPAHLGTVVHIPVEVPAGGADARIEIIDGANQLVRRIELARGSVPLILVDWDGRNAHGEPCAPGVYVAWLVSGDARQFVRIGWVP
jgi:hypothetical protein